jgi:DNA-binding NtrC family response regulator
MELYMPGLDAAQFVAHCCHYHPLTRLVIVSGAISLNEEAEKLEVRDWFQKPYDPEDLLRCLRAPKSQRCGEPRSDELRNEKRMQREERDEGTRGPSARRTISVCAEITHTCGVAEYSMDLREALSPSFRTRRGSGLHSQVVRNRDQPG